MSAVALMSDVHGNGLALEAVVSDWERLGADRAVCLGDIAAGGPQPREALERVRRLGWPTVRGNADSWLTAGLPAGESEETRRLDDIVGWARSCLSAPDLAWLSSLPASVSIAVEGWTLFCFHGSPHSDLDSLLAGASDQRLDELLRGAPPAQAYSCGHTHIQLLRRHARGLIVNPGSVGLPLGSLQSVDGWTLPGWAEYALLRVEGGDLELTFRRVPVDVSELVAQSRDMPHPSWAGDLERRIRRWNKRAAR